MAKSTLQKIFSNEIFDTDDLSYEEIDAINIFIQVSFNIHVLLIPQYLMNYYRANAFPLKSVFQNIF